MDAAINPISIFLPMLAMVALTVVAFGRMAVARSRAAKEVNPDYYRAYLGPPEPEYAIVAVRHYGNVLELPVLLYAGCLTAYVIGAVSLWLLVWAWGYVACRFVQSFVHLTVNKPALRGMAFAVSWLFMIALWVTLAMSICAML